ncbi:MAG: amino acid adenylation domain-containing protein, partial [Bacteroidota bacterium]
MAELIEKSLLNEKVFGEREQLKLAVEVEIEDLKSKVLAQIESPHEVEDVYPMRDIQKGMVLQSELETNSGLYHNRYVYQIPSVDKKVFENAYKLLIQKHETLRTSLDLTNYHQPVQIVRGTVDFEIDHHDIKNLGKEEKENYVINYMIAGHQQPFDLMSGMLWRVSLFNLNEDADLLLIQFHHAILDGWSMASLNTELADIYQQLKNNTTPHIELLKATNRDAVIEEIIDKSDKRIIDFWKKELDGYKRLDIFEKDQVDKTFVYTYDKAFRKKVEKSCNQDGTTIQSVMYGAFVYALNVISLENDFVVGMISHNRPLIEDGDKLLGCFLNTMPVRNRFNTLSELTISAYNQEINELILKIKAHDRLTLYEISNQLNESAVNDSPFFDVLFNYIDFHIYNEMSASMDKGSSENSESVEIEYFDPTNTYLDLSVNVSGEGIRLEYFLKKDFKFQFELKRLHNLVNIFLSNYLKNDQVKVKDVNYLSEEERKQLLKQFNNTSVRYALDKTVIDLFNEQAKRTPKAIAVKYGSISYSFEEFDGLSNQFARYLKTQYQVESNTLVGIHLKRSERLPLSILAVLKAEGGYVPIGMDYPEERISYIEKDSKLVVMITEKVVDDFFSNKENYESVLLSARPAPTDLAYCIYTSGSTGAPKGVVNQHNGLYNQMCWVKNDLGIVGGERFLQRTPHTFDASIWEVLLPLIAGSTLVMIEPEGHKNPKYLAQVIKTEKINVVQFVPSMLEIFMDYLDSDDATSLQHVICGGEYLPQTLVQKVKTLLTGVRIHNYYGPTEATIQVVTADVTDFDLTDEIPIGRPVSNTRIYIVNDHLGLQPRGIPGELLVSGVQVAHGYLNLEELARERFIDDPFEKGNRVYRTGDLASWNADGTIKFLGRKDNQVKIRGNRIELGEIESKVQSSGMVKNVAVLVYGEERKYLMCYVVAGERYEESMLFGYLERSLPDYMLPSRIEVLESFPFTSSGKVDRTSLLEMSNDLKIKRQIIAPRTEKEKEVLEVWQKILRYDEISIDDNFFRVGGDSIISIRLISELNKQYDINLSITQLYQSSSIAELVPVIEQAQMEGDDLSNRQMLRLELEKNLEQLRQNVLSNIDNPEAFEDVYPMRDIQKGMILLAERHEELGVYHNQLIYEVPAVDSELFEQAYQILIEKHPVLRTSFDLTTYTVPVQLIRKTIDFNIDKIDISHFNENEQKNYIEEYMLQERSRPFKSDSKILWRVSLFDKNEKENIVLFQFHHVILDGWSVASLNTELSQIYAELENKTFKGVTKLKTTEKAAVIEELLDKSNEAVKDYWTTELADYKRLDVFEERTSLQSYHQNYDSSFRKRLERRCEADGVTIRSILYGSLIYGLNILNVENDFVVGVVTNNRPQSEDGDKLLGCFLNTIPLRNRFDELSDLSLEAFYKHQENKLSEVRQYERLTLYEIARMIGDVSEKDAPFFDVMYNYVDFHAYDDLRLRQKESTGEDINESIDSVNLTNMVLDFSVNTFGEGLTVDYRLTKPLKYNFTLEQLHYYIDLILKCYVEGETGSIDELDYLTSKERELLLTQFNDTAKEYAAGKTVVDLFEEQVKKNGKAIAVQYESKSYSYKELDAISNQLARYLHGYYEIEANDLVGIRLERSERLPLVILSILKAGGAYVPIGVDYPEERVAYIEENGGLKEIVTESILLDFFKVQANYSESSLKKKPGLTDLAYCIYTSGSTGRPKGVLNQHDGLYNRLQWTLAEMEVNSADVFIQKTPYTFDVSVWEFLLPLTTGSKLVMAAPEGHKDPIYLKNVIQKESVSIVHFVPSMLGLFLDMNEGEVITELKHVVCSGEELPVAMVERSRDLSPNARIHNYYGPTEAAIDVTSIDLTEEDLSGGVSIGRPVPNTRLYIVNDNLGIQPIGIPGELLISGVQVAQGYLNMEELTRDRFIADPFNKGGRVYRTGDLASWNADGTIKFLGRKDNQVKIRGNRIELGEIESRIQSSGMVKNVAVLVQGEERKYLLCYVMPDEGYEETLLYNYLEQSLPEYMIPSQIEVLESFPLTRSGKVDRKKILVLSRDLKVKRQVVAPRTEKEKEILEIWQKVLGHNEIGVEDNFFRIGGDSIVSIRLISELNKQYDVNLNITQLYQSSTIAELVPVIEQAEKGETDSNERLVRKLELEDEIVSLKEHVLSSVSQPNEIEDVYPMRDIQKGMILLAERNVDLGVYHNQYVYEIPSVDRDLFERAYQLLLKKHSMLRTSFDLTTYERPLQIIRKDADFKIDYVDISHLRQSDQKEYVEAYMRSGREMPFNTQTDLLWRVSLFTISEDQDLVLFQFHHAILDGWSLASLNTELSQIYTSLRHKTFTELAPLKVNEKNAVIEELLDKSDDRIAEFWKEELEDYKRLDIFEERIELQSYYHSYSQKFRKELEQRCAADGISLRTALYGSLIYGLNVINLENDFVVGVVTNNRPLLEDGDQLLGCYLNTIPMRIQFDMLSKLSLPDYYMHQEQKLTSIREYERLTLYEIARLLGEVSEKEAPFFDVMFNYVDFHAYNDLDLGGSQEKASDNLEDGIDSGNLTNMVLDFTVNTFNGLLNVNYRLTRPLKHNAKLDQLHRYIDLVLRKYVEGESISVGEIDYLTTKERNQLLYGFNDTNKGYAPQKTVVGLFAEQLDRNPEAIAVQFETKTYSYQELDRFSNQFARHLKNEFNIESNDLVGIQLDRSERLPMVILAILKARGAYVPFGVDYPKERIRYIEKNAELKVIVTEEILDKFFKLKANYSTAVLEEKPKMDDLAYCIYTSGSTGQPKGVLNQHDGLYNRLLWTREEMEVSPEDIFLQKTPYTFDVSVWEFLLPLITGAKLVLAKPEGHKDPSYLKALIQKESVSIIHFVPSMLGLFIETADKVEFSSLRHIICSGEELPAGMVERSRELFPSTQIHNYYGPTEAGIDVTSINVTQEDLSNGVSIGRPVANTRIYIVNDSLNLQPLGMAGELLISGVQVARGYLKLEELTKERFIDDPFMTGQRVYRTGDLASWNPDGTLHFLGRKDNQVKIRGNRIELGEIESKIQLSGMVKSVAVLVGGDERKYLMGYVIPEEDYNEKKLFSYLEESLPDYMVPSRIVALDIFPLTTSGKVDRKRIASMSESLELQRSIVAPRTEMEENVLQLWKEVLGSQEFGVEDNFFQIGGDSIVSIRLISVLNKQYDLNLSITQLYESTTVAELVSVIEESKKKGTSYAAYQAERAKLEDKFEVLRQKVLSNVSHPENIEDVYPMRDIQKGMVMLSELQSGQSVYHDQFVYKIQKVDIELLHKAYELLIEKHETLRTNFDLSTHGEPVQIVQKNVNFAVDYNDLKRLNAKNKESYIKEYMINERKKPFVMNKGLLWRVGLFELNDSSDMLIIQFHHAILDGWSMASLNTELSQIYRQLELDKPVVLKPLDISNKDASIEEAIENSDLKNVDFWKEYLRDYKRLDIFQNENINLIRTYNYGKNFRQQLEEVCRKDEIPLQTVFFGAYLFALNIINLEDDFVVGLVTNNRPVIEEGDKLLGCFLNTIPIRNNIKSEKLSLTAYCKAVNQNLSNTRKYERTTLHMIAKHLAEEATDSAPFFDVIFN